MQRRERLKSEKSIKETIYEKEIDFRVGARNNNVFQPYNGRNDGALYERVKRQHSRNDGQGSSNGNGNKSYDIFNGCTDSRRHF